MNAGTRRAITISALALVRIEPFRFFARIAIAEKPQNPLDM